MYTWLSEEKIQFYLIAFYVLLTNDMKYNKYKLFILTSIAFNIDKRNMIEDSIKRLNTFQESLITQKDNLIE